MNLVVDASVAVKWLVDEEGSEAARRLMLDDNVLHAPRLMASEVGNALVNKVRRGLIDSQTARLLASHISQMPVHWSEDESISADAIRIAIGLGRPVYDCVYMALAHRVSGQVVTADSRFANAIEPTEHAGDVVLLGRQ